MPQLERKEVNKNKMRGLMLNYYICETKNGKFMVRAVNKTYAKKNLINYLKNRMKHKLVDFEPIITKAKFENNGSVCWVSYFI